MLQVLTAIFKNPEHRKPLPVSLIFANQTEDDILCRTELEDIAAANPDYFKLWYTLSQPSSVGKSPKIIYWLIFVLTKF